ncbi:hypothetical protein FRB96_003593 [Tulasnella sp. 330]|nr:hypothetical protein FRB96_003593 [Tulasnella sp. 330]KAG8886229.1 hypothetical protein FRB97_006232 [Tulasnella sp. 331]KAG8887283.1 hypothetical protein FRB98_000269 [Tulasnella sp. 332]
MASTTSWANEYAIRNKDYVANFAPRDQLSAFPAHKVAIVACMDSRIDPAASLGIKEGDAHVIRNAGGRAKDALRSLVVSQLFLQSTEIIVYHHTHCGMATFQDQEGREKLREAVADTPEAEALGPVIDSFAFMPLRSPPGVTDPIATVKQSIQEDVAYLRSCELLKHRNAISGWLYDVHTGAVSKVVPW